MRKRKMPIKGTRAFDQAVEAEVRVRLRKGGDAAFDEAVEDEWLARLLFGPDGSPSVADDNAGRVREALISGPSSGNRGVLFDENGRPVRLPGSETLLKFGLGDPASLADYNARRAVGANSDFEDAVRARLAASGDTEFEDAVRARLRQNDVGERSSADMIDKGRSPGFEKAAEALLLERYENDPYLQGLTPARFEKEVRARLRKEMKKIASGDVPAEFEDEVRARLRQERERSPFEDAVFEDAVRARLRQPDVHVPPAPRAETRESFTGKAVREAVIERNAEELAYWHKKIRGLKKREEALKDSKYSDTRSVQAELKALVAERLEAQGKVNAIDWAAYVGDSDRQKNRVALAAGEETEASKETEASEITAGEPPARLGPGDDSFLWPANLEEGSTSEETIVDDTRRGYLSVPFMDAQVKAWKKENPGAELPDTLAFYEDKQRFDPEDKRIKARYRTSDLGMWERWDSNMIASMQKDFEAIGLYKAVGGKYNLGDWRGKESTFFAILLAEANMEGLDWQEMLAEWKKNPPQVILDDLSVGSGGGRTPNPIQITNPDDIRSEARTASKSLTGQMRPGFDESMVGGFQGSEIAAGQALNTEGVAGTGGVVTASATPGAYAEAQLRANSGPEVGAYSTLGAFNAILQELGLAG